MGHKDISVTLNTYTSVLKQYKEDEFGKLAQYYMNKSASQLPGPIESNDYSVHENNYDYIPDFEDDIYNAYRFNREDIINLFGDEENYEKVITESWNDILKWKEKVINKE